MFEKKHKTYKSLAAAAVVVTGTLGFGAAAFADGGVHNNASVSYMDGEWQAFRTYGDGPSRADDHAPIGVMGDHRHRQGEFMFCPDRRGMGHGVNGAFTRYVVAREEQLFELPDELPTEQGALIEPFAAAVHAVCEMSQLRLGETVLVSGPGPIGLMCLKLLVAAGMKTIVAGVSADSGRLQLGSQMGAARVVDVQRVELLDVVREETGGVGVDLALECSGVAASVANCLNALGPLGRLTQVGHFGNEITIPYDLVAFRQIRITGSVGYTAGSWRRSLQILADGDIELTDLITDRLPLDQWKAGFQAFEDGQALKVLLTP
jgi:L-iditol 2-dehydrogenase